MSCLACGYAVDKASPDGVTGEYCSCACKTFGRERRKYPLQKLDESGLEISQNMKRLKTVGKVVQIVTH